MKPETGPFNLASTFLRLRPDATVETLPVDGSFWQRLTTGALGDFHNEYLVSTSEFDSDWTGWEMHPEGDEIVCLLSGSVTFVLDTAGGRREHELTEPGSYVVVPRGTWHTARAGKPCRMLFITAGEGTRHRDSPA